MKLFHFMETGLKEVLNFITWVGSRKRTWGGTLIE
jgi:hypothetical protein